ncbi:ERMES complex subunit, partial [Ascosphaera pollenicola]
MFGYFLPLMTILGEIIDLYHLRNHPRFGSTFRNGNQWDPMVAEITRQLDLYGQSLREFDARYSNVPLRDPSVDGSVDVLPDLTPPVGPVMGGAAPDTTKTASSAASMHESYVQTKIVVAYGTHIMHVLHILLAGKWDPISLLDDNDLWISSESFIRAMGHAVSAAEAAADILDLDPDLSFMPYFFGVYLLQGSFLLLLTADKLQGDASPSVVRACETIVRAHEACVVTLNTEYQRKFRKVMRSALLQGTSATQDLTDLSPAKASPKMQPILAVLAVGALVYRAWSHRSLTPVGIFAAFLTAVAHVLHPSALPFTLLAAFFIAGTKATKVKHDIKARLTMSSGGPEGGEGSRNHIQVLANSGVASVLSLLHVWKLWRDGRDFTCIRYGKSDDILLLGIIANYAAVAADTLSSELGILSQSQPRLITSFNLRKVPR